MRAIVIAVIVLLLPIRTARAVEHLSTQREINELAARFIDAQEALSGLTGSPRPGEDRPRYQTRIRGYLRALDQAVRDSADLRSTTRPDAVWKHITEDAGRLKDETARCHVIWEKQPGPNFGKALGQSMAKALQTLLSMLNGLRDARP